MARSLGRGGHRWRVLAAQVRAEETHCYLCGAYIDRMLMPRSPMSYSIDHVIPLLVAPELALERGNVRAAHLKCNVARSNRMRNETRTNTTSRAW